MVRLQREMAEGGEIVVAGRDIGTVVLPDADLKITSRLRAWNGPAAATSRRGFVVRR